MSFHRSWNCAKVVLFKASCDVGADKGNCWTLFLTSRHLLSLRSVGVLLLGWFREFCIWSHICKLDFIVVAYEDKNLSTSNIKGHYKLLCLVLNTDCLLYTSPSPRDLSTYRMPSSA